MKKQTITIAIPAFNEAHNIGVLLNDVFLQDMQGLHVEKIIVVSDGSTDATADIAQSIKDSRIQVIDDKKRKGLAARLNQIHNLSQSEILIVLNADTRIKDKYFLKRITKPIRAGKADLTSPAVKEVPPTGFFEETLYISTKIKNFAFEKFNKGNNVYTCRGVARAFSKRLYKKIKYSTSIGDDAFSYFFCVTNNFNYYFVRETKIIFKLPDNLEDHSKQSLRFFKSQQLLKKEFGDQFVTKSYNLPKPVLIHSIAKNFINHHIFTSVYIALLFYLKLKSLFLLNSKDQWDSVGSSKKITL